MSRAASAQYRCGGARQPCSAASGQRAECCFSVCWGRRRLRAAAARLPGRLAPRLSAADRILLGRTLPLLTLGSAPPSINSRTTSKYPRSTARCSGERLSALTLGFAPLANSLRTASASPLAEAVCRGVQPPRATPTDNGHANNKQPESSHGKGPPSTAYTPVDALSPAAVTRHKFLSTLFVFLWRRKGAGCTMKSGT